MFLSAPLHASAIGLLVGSIEFPSLDEGLTIRLYYEGQIVKTEVQGNKLVYRIPTSRDQFRYFLLFVEDIDFVVKATGDDNVTQNTIEYLIAHPNVPYRVFELQKKGDGWFVVERLLPVGGRIPDSTIIVLHPAGHVNTVSGGNRFQLPSIVMKDNIVDLAGSEEKLQDTATELLLASLDCDALHVTMKENIKRMGNHVLFKPAA